MNIHPGVAKGGKVKVLEMIDQPFLGGGQKNLLSLSLGLNRDRFEVCVCSKDGGPLVEEVKRAGIKHYPICFSKTPSPAILDEIYTLLKKNHFDIVHTHGGVAGFFGRLAAKKYGTPFVIHTLHGIHYLHYRNPFLKALFILQERYLSRFTHFVIFVSESDRVRGQRYRLVPREKMVLIRNGIDAEKFSQRLLSADKILDYKKKLGLESSSLIVGTVARLHRQKGIIYLLRAFQKVVLSLPQARLLLVGDGQLRKKLEKEAAHLGLGKYVLFLGEREDVAELISIFDVFVLPSLWEGLPFVLLEAAVAGKPVVASDIEGVREIIKSGKNGLLVPAKEHRALADAILNLLRKKDLALRLGEQLRKDVPSRFKIFSMIEETQNLYLKAKKENQ